MKRSRPLSLFLSVLILISCFTVSVSASDTANLIDSNLENWSSIYPDSTTVKGFNYIDNRIIFRIGVSADNLTDTTTYIRAGSLYDLADFKAGDSYTFSIDLLSYQQVMDTGLFSGFSEAFYYWPYLKNDGVLYIGLGSYNSSIDNIDFVDGAYIAINSDNYLDYYGKNNSITFELPNIVNPCIFITYLGASNYGNNFMLYVENAKLVNNTELKEDGFFQKLFAWFQEKFDAIGDSFTNLGNKLTELKNSFLDSLSNLGDTIGSFFDKQLEGIIDFFRGFGNLILYFNWEGEYTNPFEREDSPIDKVSEFFDNLIEYVDSIGTSIENVLDSITGGLHIFDEFTSRFPWLKGIAVFCLALIVITRFIGL